jgi:AcrR family transcriptional regulator
VTDTEIGPHVPGLPTARTARSAPDRREAICEAVFQLLGEVGYDRMTMDAIATRARASKATLYRTWPDKPSLVAEALTWRFGATPAAPNTGSLRGDLMALVSLACRITNSPDGEVLTGVMTAAARNPTLARTLYECTFESKQIMHETITRLAVARGELLEVGCAGLLHEVMYAMILTRKLTSDEPMDEAFAAHVVDDVLIPVLTYQSAAAGVTCGSAPESLEQHPA